MLGSIELRGLGNIKLPVSTKDLPRLKSLSEQAPYGFGEQTLLDSNVRQAWQIDPGKLSFPANPEFLTRSSFEIATSALAELGVDAGEVLLELKLYKMLLYEPGGHFKFHRDTEKEDGMFATLIIQLPTQTGHEGGVLTVRHGDSSKHFDFRSTTGFFYTLFFCDCKHELSKITRGSRVCLVFSLVKKSTSFLPADKPAFFLAARPRVESLLREWADSRARQLMIIPLGHRYAQKSPSFPGLKGHDRVVADLVRRCEFLEVHLCTLTMKQYEEDYSYHLTREYWLENWETSDDSNAEFGETDIRIAIETGFGLGDVLRVTDCHDPFHDDPDETKDYWSREGDSTEKFYHLGALVVWARNRRIEVMCSCFTSFRTGGFSSVPEDSLDTLVARFLMKKHPTLETPEARSELRELIEFSIKFRRRGAWSLLFTWACRAELKDDALKLLKLLNHPCDAEVVQLLGWEELKRIYGDHLLEGIGFLRLLKSAGRDRDAVELARMMVSNLSKLNDQRKIDKLLAFCLSESSLEREVMELAEKAPLELLIMSPVFHGRNLEAGAAVSKRIDAVESPEELMRLAELVLVKLEASGAHDTAVELASRLRNASLGIPSEYVEECFSGHGVKPFFLYPFLDKSRARALLSTQVLLEKKYEKKYEKKELKLLQVLMFMRNSAGLLRLKIDEEATATFAELCAFVISHVSAGYVPFGDSEIDEAEERAQQEYESHGKEFSDGIAAIDMIENLLEVVFWLADEALIERMVSLLKDRPHLAWKLLRRESGFVLRAMSLGDPARRGLKRLAEVRLGYLVSGLEYGKKMISGLELAKGKNGAKKRKVCGTRGEKLIDDPRMLRVLESLREEEWGSHAAAEVNDLEFLCSFAS